MIRDDVASQTGVLVLAATPIGRAADASPRLATELAGADVIAAEDTRRLARLAAELGVDGEGPGHVLLRGQRGGPDARRWSSGCVAGDRVVLVTDAGMPSVSDPGYRLVAAAVEAGVGSPPSPARRRC